MGSSAPKAPAALTASLVASICEALRGVQGRYPPTRRIVKALHWTTVGWKGELKDRSARHVRRRPQPALVGGDDRTADGEPHTHAIWLRCRRARTTGRH